MEEDNGKAVSAIKCHKHFQGLYVTACLSFKRLLLLRYIPFSQPGNIEVEFKVLIITKAQTKKTAAVCERTVLVQALINVANMCFCLFTVIPGDLENSGVEHCIYATQ